MKTTLLASLALLAATLPAAGEYVPRDTRIGGVYAQPLGDVYASAMGVEIQYRLWYWETTAVSLIGSLQQWELADDSELAAEDDFTGFDGSPSFIQAGVGIDERIELGERLRVNLHTDLRYCNGLSGAKAQLSNGDFTREQTVDVSDAIVGGAGVGLEFEASRDWTLYVEAGLQAGLVPGEIASGGTTIDNELEALLVRFGAVFGF